MGHRPRCATWKGCRAGASASAEAYLDSLGKVGEAVTAILAAIAKQERVRCRSASWSCWRMRGAQAAQERLVAPVSHQTVRSALDAEVHA